MAEIAENAQDVEMFLAQHGHTYTKISFTFTIESVTLLLLTSARPTVSFAGACWSHKRGGGKIYEKISLKDYFTPYRFFYFFYSVYSLFETKPLGLKVEKNLVSLKEREM